MYVRLFFKENTTGSVRCGRGERKDTDGIKAEGVYGNGKWKFLLNQVNPKNAMRSFGTFVSKIDWSKSDSLRELFRPFEHLGTEKIYAL